MSEDNKMFVRLKDPGTTFYDAEQDLSLVSTRIGRAVATARLMQAIQAGQVIEMSADEARIPYNKQQKELREQGILPPLPAKPKVEEEEAETEEEDPDAVARAAAAKKTTPKK